MVRLPCRPKKVFRRVRTDGEVAAVSRILASCKRSGYLRPRSTTYLDRNRRQFYISVSGGIVIGCVEKKVIDARTVELGALATARGHRHRRVGLFTVRSFLELTAAEGFSRCISLTNNPCLKALYARLGFVQDHRQEYQDRQDQSPGVTMFFRQIETPAQRSPLPESSWATRLRRAPPVLGPPLTSPPSGVPAGYLQQKREHTMAAFAVNGLVIGTALMTRPSAA